MSADFSIAAREGYVEVRLKGIGGLDVGKRLWSAVRDVCVETGCKRILGIGEHDVAPSILEGFQHVDLWRALGFDSSYRIAWVERSKTELEKMRFIETALSNRGLPGRLFEDVAEAEQWLLK